MSDREQAIDDVAKHLRCEIDAVIEACKEDELAMKYAVAQRERVIALERALRGLLEIDDGDDPALWGYASQFANARAALNGESK